MSFTTADLCDRHEAGVRVVAPGFRDYGGLPCFSGPIATVKVHEDNSQVRAALETPGEGGSWSSMAVDRSAVRW